MRCATIFAKSERDNIDPDELQFWRRLAAAFLTMTDAQLAAMVNAGEITEVTCHE